MRRRFRDAGSATLQTMLVLPALLLAVTVVVQAVLYEHAVQVARSAAAQALTAVEAVDGSPATGQLRARSVLRQLGSPLSAVHVTATRAGGRASISVTGQVPRLLPFGVPRVRETATGPVEAWTP